MIDEILRTSPNFYPSKETRARFKSVRKEEDKAGDFILPGLFQLYNFTIDRLLFWIAIAVEIAGLVMMSFLSNFSFYMIGTIFAFVIADIILAIVIHKPVSELCQLTNEEAIYQFETQHNLDSLSSTNLAATKRRVGALESSTVITLAKIGLWVIAAIKVFGFFILIGTINGYIVLAVILYSAVAYIHSKHTGYYLAGRALRVNLKGEHARYLYEINKKGNYTVTNEWHISKPALDTPITVINGLEISVVRISIANSDDLLNGEKREVAIYQSDNLHWMFKSWGLFTDLALKEFVQNKEVKNKEYVAYLCLKNQMKQLM